MTGAPFPVPAPADLAEAFRWSEHRTVSKTALVSLHGNRYQVDPVLVGRKVELVFDPFDLTFLRVRCDDLDAGTALPFQITRHSHPKARPEVAAEPPPPTTGIDYLALIDAVHTGELAAKVNYAALAPAVDPHPEPDPALAAELAEFAALRQQLADPTTQPTTGGADTDRTADLA
jgi:putative transposase